MTTTYVQTKTGKTAHIGSASKGQVQTLCGIGYGRRAVGRMIPASMVKPEHVCQRCAAMSADEPATEERFAEPVAVVLGEGGLTTWAWTPVELERAQAMRAR